MGETSTDCRSEEGVTVGLVDTVITVCRVLAGRDLRTPAVREALADLAGDEDAYLVLRAAEVATGYRFVCPGCWYELPTELRQAIRQSFRRDEETHLQAMVDAVRWYGERAQR